MSTTSNPFRDDPKKLRREAEEETRLANERDRLRKAEEQRLHERNVRSQLSIVESELRRKQTDLSALVRAMDELKHQEAVARRETLETSHGNGRAHSEEERGLRELKERLEKLRREERDLETRLKKIEEEERSLDQEIRTEERTVESHSKETQEHERTVREAKETIRSAAQKLLDRERRHTLLEREVATLAEQKRKLEAELRH